MKNQPKEIPKTSKITSEATKGNKNEEAGGHENEAQSPEKLWNLVGFLLAAECLCDNQMANIYIFNIDQKHNLTTAT